MANLMRASQELFRRTPDECFFSVNALAEHCRHRRETSREIVAPPAQLAAQTIDTSRLLLAAGDDGAFQMNDWSFSQLCRLAGVGRDTLNRLSPEAAAQDSGSPGGWIRRNSAWMPFGLSVLHCHDAQIVVTHSCRPAEAVAPDTVHRGATQSTPRRRLLISP